ncbi:MAG: NADPH:quinone reductase [Pseudomonadota bacterium]
MRAAVYDRTGPAHEVLQIIDMPTPAAGPGEVRIRLQASGVNPSDVKSRGGMRPMPFPRMIPHSDGAGVIDQAGAGVPEERVGERVWTWNAAWQRPHGTAAEYIVLPAIQAVPLPPDVDMAVGACLGIPALTAYHAVNVDGGVVGKRVFIPGGAGAVGHYAIQMARLMGAKQVITTVSGPEKAVLAKQAGADLVLNYRTDDVSAAVQQATRGEGVDRIIEVDFAANLDTNLQIVKTDGQIIVYGSSAPELSAPFYPLVLKNIGLKFFILYNLDAGTRARATEHLTAMLEKNSLQHNIAARLPLEQIADAHEMVRQGQAMGNVVILIK